MLAATPIDDFLGRATTDSGVLRWEGIAAGVGIAATAVVVGFLSLAAFAHPGTRDAVARLLRVVLLAGVALIGGSIVETAVAADSLGTGWATALTDGSSVGAMLRFLAGGALVLGFIDETVSVGGLRGSPDTVSSPDGRVDLWVPGPVAALGFSGAMLAVVSFAFDGHTVTEGPRVVHALVNVVHVGSAGVWGGGVLGLAVLATGRRRTAIGPSFERFSPIATAVVGPLLVSGVVMSFFVLDAPGDLVGTPWGRALLVKSTLVLFAVALGAHHHRLVARRRSDGVLPTSVGRSVAVEAVLITGVVVAAAVLARSSTV